jgi:hypothetical protein
MSDLPKGDRLMPLHSHRELRLFGGGGTDHLYRLRLSMSPEEASLNAALHRLNVRSLAVAACRREAEPFSVAPVPQHV